MKNLFGLTFETLNGRRCCDITQQIALQKEAFCSEIPRSFLPMPLNKMRFLVFRLLMTNLMTPLHLLWRSYVDNVLDMDTAFGSVVYLSRKVYAVL
jgi:hypothetical protein